MEVQDDKKLPSPYSIEGKILEIADTEVRIARIGTRPAALALREIVALARRKVAELGLQKWVKHD